MPQLWVGEVRYFVSHGSTKDDRGGSAIPSCHLDDAVFHDVGDGWVFTVLLRGKSDDFRRLAHSVAFGARQKAKPYLWQRYHSGVHLWCDCNPSEVNAGSLI